MKYFLLYLFVVFAIISRKMSQDNFYLHLNSDVHLSSPLQISNTIGNFVTRLPRRYNLEGDYEVALSRFHYTKSWYNIEKP